MINPTLIASTPCLEWPASQRQLVKVTCSPATGRTLADWASFVLTIRIDPNYPRSGGTLYDALDPSGDSWTASVTSTGSITGTTEVTFDLTVPSSPGIRRYALDVRGVGGTAGLVSFLPATWLTVTPSVR